MDATRAWSCLARRQRGEISTAFNDLHDVGIERAKMWHLATASPVELRDCVD